LIGDILLSYTKILELFTGAQAGFQKVEIPGSLTWYGYATLGLGTGGKQIPVDPYFSGMPAF
jgi:hypothetical protein